MEEEGPLRSFSVKRTGLKAERRRRKKSFGCVQRKKKKSSTMSLSIEIYKVALQTCSAGGGSLPPSFPFPSELKTQYMGFSLLFLLLPRTRIYLVSSPFFDVHFFFSWNRYSLPVTTSSSSKKTNSNIGSSSSSPIYLARAAR